MKFPLNILKRCWFLAGPTACGKTAAGIALAQKIGAEIISLDSMAIYRGMDIGTAKPTLDEQRRIPHHLIDAVDPHEEFTTAQYLQRAEQACHEILARNHTPLFVGGTGLYLRSVLRGVFDGPPADRAFRELMEIEAQRSGPQPLYDRLAAIDPVTAARLHPHDLRRVIRALEIHHATGSAPSQLRGESPLPEQERPRHVYWLAPPRHWLYERINRRVDAMLAAGLVDEVRRLLARPQGMGHTARQGLGYKEVIEFLEGRIASEHELRQTIQTRSRQFAKRQMTWFRNLEECQAIAISGEETPDQLAELILAHAFAA